MSSAKRLAIAAIVLIGVSYATVIQSFSWNQTSHYDLIRSLDQDRTTIDPYQANTGDKAFYKGHYYSARAPGLALYALPFYDGLKAAGAESWAYESVAQRNDDEMIYLLGLWGSVLPGLVLLLLLWRVAERFQPGYGAVCAIALGLGTMLLPLSTLLFSHVFSACLGFLAFWLLLREREGEPNMWLCGAAGVCLGYAISAEYPLFLCALALAGYLLSRRDALTVRMLARRLGAYVLGGAIGIVPLLLYNHYAFHSFTHLAYSDIPRQQKGFFGIGSPSLRVAATLLGDSRGLLTLSPVLIMAAIGTVLAYRRGRRAEALTIGAICLLYLSYNSGYYLPFGGGFMGPRFLSTALPFLIAPLGLALKRYPGPTIALLAISVAANLVASITHPLVGYETETVVWARYLRQGFFQPTIATAYGLGRGWGGIWPFLAAAAGGIGLGFWASERIALARATLLAGVASAAAWAAFAAVGPTVLGLDHQGLLDIVKAGDSTALHKGFGSYPLATLALIALGCALLSLLAGALLDRGPGERTPPPSVPPGASHAERGPAGASLLGG